jgi:hypothetical protein
MSLRALAVGGHVSLIGASLTASGAGLDPLLLSGRGITLGAIGVGSRADFEGRDREKRHGRGNPGRRPLTAERKRLSRLPRSRILAMPPGRCGAERRAHGVHPGI